MKCLKCKGSAVLQIKRHKAAFCSEHLIEHLQNQMMKAIRKFKMLPPSKNVLVAVSGGKDSLALWDMLLEKGYKADAFYIDLGIHNYSNESLEMIEKFSKDRPHGHYYIISLPDIYQTDIKEISKNNPRSACSACGLIKRYIMNIMAREGGYHAVATGHNLDDESATLLGNTLYWQTGYLGRQSPNMPPRHGLARKIKPLCRLTEKETAAYCLVKSIDYILEDCPLAQGASTFKYKEIINRLETQSPGTKDQFYLGFLRKGKYYFEKEHEEIELVGCPTCGEPTVNQDKDCSFCRQMKMNALDPILLKMKIAQLI